MGQSDRREGRGCLAGLFVLGATMLILMSRMDCRAPDSEERPAPVSSPGPTADREMVIGVAGGPAPAFLLAADSRESLDANLKAILAGDKIGQLALIEGGHVFPVSPGTRVLPLESTLTTRGVRILEGKHAGRIAWFAREFVIER